MKISTQPSVKEKAILVFFLVALSGMPFFTNLGDIGIILLFLYSSIRYLLSTTTFPRFFWAVLFFLAGLVGCQTIVFEYFSVTTTIGLFIRWSTPFFVVLLLGKDFVNLYVKLLYALCIISFAIYFPLVLFPPIETFLVEQVAPIFHQEGLSKIHGYNPSIVLYTFNLRQSNFGVVRNSGPFWEAGAFAGYTIVALVFSIINSPKLSKYTAVFLLAIITTFSTSGYLAAILLVFFYLLFVRGKGAGWFVMPFLLVGLVYMIYSNDVFFSKLNQAIEQTQTRSSRSAGRTRIVSAQLDIEDIKKYPLVGRGRAEITRFGKEGITRLEHRNNGVTDFIVKYGIPFSLFYFYFIFVSFRSYLISNKGNPRFAYGALMLILVIGFSETYFQQSFFIALFFLHLVFVRKRAAND